ncbi:LBP / BPI / CETP family domain protein [Trichinella spiralis]|uniref:LBP / BPI / CETP family domain protein n=1 Tax=Trichinella spiralis TaxID=6334 RepID=UPI0001EFCDAF|nr:LBP / BPI / CETP family domain protein [Trichinella spiralis]
MEILKKIDNFLLHNNKECDASVFVKCRKVAAICRRLMRSRELCFAHYANFYHVEENFISRIKTVLVRQISISLIIEKWPRKTASIKGQVQLIKWATPQPINEPGIRVFLTKKGLERVLDEWKKLFWKQLALREPVKLRIYGLRDYIVINNLRVGRIAKAAASAFIEPGIGFKVMVQNLNIDYVGTLTARYHSEQQTVNMVANIPDLSFNVVVRVENKNGFLQPKMHSCEAFASESVTLQFNGPIPRALSAMRLLHTSVLQNFVEKSLCKHVPTLLFPPFRTLFNPPTRKLKLFENYFLDYSMVGNVTIGSDYMETEYSGEIYMDRGFKHSTSTAVKAPPMKIDHKRKTDSSMAYIYLSDYSINTLLYSLYRAGKFDMAVNHKTTPESFVNYLKTGCQESQICAGTIFPSLGDKYPNSTLDIQIKLLKLPKATIKNDAIEIASVSTMKGSVRSQRNRQYLFFSCQMDLVTVVKRFRLRRYYAHVDVSFDHMELRDVQSDIPGIDKMTMSFVVSYALDLLVKPDVQAKLKHGFKLPRVTDFEMTNGIVELVNDLIIVGFDFCQSDCIQSQIGNADNLDKVKISNTYDDY